MYEDFDTTGLSLTGDVLLLEHQNPLPLEEQVIDPSLRNHSGTSEHSRTAIDPSQSAQHQPTVSTVRVPYAGASTPPSSPAWIDGTDRLNYRDSRFLALPTETPTKQPLKEGSDLRHVNQGTMCTKDAGAGEQRQWEWSQSPSEHAQAQYDADNFTPRYGVSAEDAVVDAGVVLDFLGQPEADGMVAPKDVNGIMNVYSLVYRMQ
ncbi:hypothetical protein CGMCC3_g17876 [Colletotrichum fructicola]|nr:uncharacterized protein CGMCC3_g17876 [Colletotrichum fructicola]KAE9565944.1 hypothetical protein CGMCC3_g17876 [Colletotrichum fructicola]